MHLPEQRKGLFGWFTVLCVLTTAVVLNMFGTFRDVDHYWYDLCQQLTSESRQKSHVVLIYTPESFKDAPSEKFERLLAEVDKCEPRQIGIVDGDALSIHSQISHLPFADRIVYGTSLEETCAIQNDERFTGNPPSTGFTDLHLTGQSVYRTAQTRAIANDQTFFSFESVVAASMLPSNELIPSGEFGIRFGRGTEAIPHITSEDLLTGNVVPELIKGKVVLIGSQMAPTYGLVTPTTAADQRMSRLELRGNIVETLLRQQGITRSGHTVSIVLLLILAIVFCQLARQLTRRWIPGVFIFAVAVCCSISAAMFCLLGTYLPFAAMVFVAEISFASIVWQRFCILSGTTGFLQLMQNVSRTRDKAVDQDEVWQLITDSALELVFPRRVVLLELPTGAMHLKVAKTANCDATSVFEKRRDVQRSPYRDAADQDAPLRLETRQFFVTDDSPNEVEYLVPLKSGSVLLGFIVLAMNQETIDGWNNFEGFLSQYAKEMTELIADQRVALRREASTQSFVGRMRTLPELREFETIQTQMNIDSELNRRLEGAFEVSESGRAVCDIFGRMIRYNMRLADYLQDAGMVASKVSCIDMMSRLSGRPADECRDIFRLAIASGRSEQIFIPAGGHQEHSSVMYVKPVRRNDANTESDFVARGAIVEIIDGAVFEKLDHWQQQLTVGMAEDVKGRIEELREQADKLTARGTDGDSMDALFGCFGDTVSEVLTLIQDCQEISRCRVTADPSDFLDVDTQVIWDSSLAGFQRELEGREIKVVSTSKAQNCNGIANPLLLEKMFSTILEVLIKNAFDSSSIFVGTENVDGELRYEISSFGDDDSPVETIRRELDRKTDATDSMNEEAVLNDEQVDRLNEIRSWLETWNGNLVIQSGDQCGLTIKLTLKTEVKPGRRRSRKDAGNSRKGS